MRNLGLTCRIRGTSVVLRLSRTVGLDFPVLDEFASYRGRISTFDISSCNPISGWVLFACTARQLRYDYGGGWYHVMSRGFQRQTIFRDDGERGHFLGLLAGTVGRYGVILHAYPAAASQPSTRFAQRLSRLPALSRLQKEFCKNLTQWEK